jgi:hypothetical protein
MKTRDARVLILFTILSDGKALDYTKKIVDDKKMALQIGAFSYSQEDYGTYILYGLPQAHPENLLTEIDSEIVNYRQINF